MLLGTIAETSESVAAVSARRPKIELLVALLGRTRPGEAAVAVAWLSGELRQRQIGVGWAALRDVSESAAPVPSLTVVEVNERLAAIGRCGGPGSQAERRSLLADLFARLTEVEQRFLARLLGGELRQGAQEGLMVDAVARAAQRPVGEVRRATMVHGNLGDVAEAALFGPPDALAGFRLSLGRAVVPMLAQTADDVDDAQARFGAGTAAAFEWKLDGARIQVHRDGSDVAVFTRSLDDVTARVPEIVERVLGLAVPRLILDGEVMAYRPDGRPQPFQVTMSRFGTRAGPASAPTGSGSGSGSMGGRDRTVVELHPHFFDVLHADGHDLIDEPLERRVALLDGLVPTATLVPRLITAEAAEARAFLAEAVARGHEGIMAKALGTPYEAGRRGAGWLKVKPVHTLDLVVLAVEWGSGRRVGWLSNLHLGAADPANGGFIMLGKTFKGLTDAMLAWQTEHLLSLEIARDERTVHVRPELVVEIAFDGLQASSRYPGGLALRFARVKSHRPELPVSRVATIDQVRAHGAGATTASDPPST